MESSPKNIVLMANYRPGLKVCEYLVEHGENISRLYLTELESDTARETIRASGLEDCDIFTGDSLKDAGHAAGLSKIEPDFIITVYWPYLLKPEVFRMARQGTINFHPALLPVNRGWYPHVHSILDGSPTGVTLHALDETADTGPVWAQKNVELSPYDTAKSIYDRLQDEIISLFRQEWPKIKSGQVKPKPQDEQDAVYHKRIEVDELDLIDLDKKYTGRELINILRARSFGERGFAYYSDNGERVYANLRLSKTDNFDGE